MKIMTVVGARPQFVKAAVLSRIIAERDGVNEVLVHTGQHYDQKMSDVFFTQMAIPKPDYTLETGGKSHGEMTGRMLCEIEPILIKEKPDVLLVYGDTNSTLAGALVAAKLHVPVAHVEAGLRSFNMNMPEEINRVLTDRISNWLFCPTGVSKSHLLKEGTQEERIHVVGDIMYDAALFYSETLQADQDIKALADELKDFYLCTVHRAENTDSKERLSEIFSGLRSVSETTPVVLPLHPRTKKKLQEFEISSEGLKIVEPLPYGDTLYLLRNSKGLITDSGGMQKEAYFFKKPCVTLRDETEWVETVDAKVNELVGSSGQKLEASLKTFQANPPEFPDKLYGDGDTGSKILDILMQGQN